MRATVLLLVAGCNGLLGLDGTRVEDRDDDGIVDSLDNCPDVANEDQLDTDADAVGDVCDTCTGCVVCAVGPPHDEDLDSIADGCDNCPTIANLDQVNTDGDDLGDACDVDNATAQRRLAFDGFGTLDETTWTQSGGSWHIVDDGVVPIDDGPHDLGFQLVLRDRPVMDTTPWTFETVFVLPGGLAANDQIGAFVDKANASHQWGCVLTYDGAAWSVNVEGGAVELGTGAEKIVIGSPAAGSTVRTCAVGGRDVTDTFGFGEYPYAVELFTRVIARFEYIDVIQTIKSD